MQNILSETAPEAWPRIAPLLDAAMGHLNDTDRHALVLRFFDGKSMNEVGAAMGLSEEAAKKRVTRAVEKLQKFFFKRGVDSSANVLTESIGAHSVQAAPALLAKAVTAIALAKGTTASTSTLTLIKGALKVMAWTKMKTAAVVGVAAIVAISATTGTVVAIQKHRANEVENYFAHWDKYSMDTVSLPEVVLLRPSKYANKGDYVLASSDLSPEGRLMRRGASFQEVLQTAYGFGPEQMILPPNLPRGRFDVLLTVPNNSRELLRAEIKKQYGITAHTETRDTDVLVLTVISTNAPGIKVSAGGGPNIWGNRGSLKLVGYKISDPSGYDLSHVIGSFYNKPVVDETGLTDAYDVDVKWNGNLRGAALQKEIERIIREQYGLEITPANRPLDMLVVEKAK